MARAFLSLGCNIGECRDNLGQALAQLEEDPETSVERVSSVYVTEPVGRSDQPDFLNITAAIETGREPRSLLELCRAVETRLGGREDREENGPRTIDIDILLYEGEVRDDPELQLPHPLMTGRAFVMVPLAEIAPDEPLPGGGTVAEALAGLHDEHAVEKSGVLNGFLEDRLG